MSGCGCKECSEGSVCPGGVCSTRAPATRRARGTPDPVVYAQQQPSGYMAAIGMMPPVYVAPYTRGARLTAEEIALARLQLEDRRERDRMAREEAAAQRTQAEAERARTTAAVSAGITQAGDIARTGISAAAQTEVERIRAARDEAVARANADANVERELTRRAELERGIGSPSYGLESGSSMSTGTLVVGAVVVGGVLYLLTRKKRRGRR